MSGAKMKTSEFQRESSIMGDSDEDTKLLKAMALEARRYLGGFSWCPAIRCLYLASGIGGVVAVFLVELKEKINEEDEYLWVIVGDLPSAYLVTEDIATPKEAIEAYCSIMEQWVSAVKSGTSLEDVYPVAVSPTRANAVQLLTRLQFLRERIIPGL